MSADEKIDPTDDIDDPADVFDFPFTTDTETVHFLDTHGRIFFIVRGLPGSKKSVLGNSLKELYTSSKMLWADKIFLGPVAGPRTHKGVAESHKICYDKIEKFMQDNIPVIINRNTNVAIAEVARYIRLALQYGYTIIIADTSTEVKTAPELLKYSNSKRLGHKYMTIRGSQWEEIYPLYTGWFLRPSDGFHLQKRYAEISDILAKSGWCIPKIVHPEVQVFCLGRLCFFGKAPEDQAYCDSDKVKNGIGQRHTLTMFGFAVVDNIALAAVKLSKDEQSMIDIESQSSARGGTGIMVGDWGPTKCSVTLSDIVRADKDPEAPTRGEKLEQVPRADEVGYMVLGRTEKYEGEDFVYGRDLHDSLKRFSAERMSEGGAPSGDEVSVEEIQVFKTGNEFLIVDNGTVEVDSVFTGFYQSYCGPVPVCKYFNKRKGCMNGPACKYRHMAC